jgi:hypothetical protein
VWPWSPCCVDLVTKPTLSSVGSSVDIFLCSSVGNYTIFSVSGRGEGWLVVYCKPKYDSFLNHLDCSHLDAKLFMHNVL